MSPQDESPYAGRRDDPDPQREASAWAQAAEKLQTEAQQQTERELKAWRLSESVARAGAQLDSALKDLEDRGLVWWDRSSNTYDLHPIVRAYVFDTLEDDDRVQANERVQDYFNALPPEDAASVSSVEDLRRSITLFRALVGANRQDEAEFLWFRKLDHPLLWELGAFSTVIELIEPLRGSSEKVRTSLAFAYYYYRRHEDSLELETELLGYALEMWNVGDIIVRVQDLGILLSRRQHLAYCDRAMALANEVAKTAGIKCPQFALFRAEQAMAVGDDTNAVAFLDEADRLARSTSSPWFPGAVTRARLRRELLRGTLTHESIERAKRELHIWLDRRGLTAIEYEWLIDRGALTEALLAALEYERIERNAGLDTTPILVAVPLAQLGRRQEAAEAVADTLERVSRLENQYVPHRHLAEALYHLGREGEAIPHALAAYETAWGSGPPNYDPWAFRQVRKLMARLAVTEPELPIIGPDDVILPFEDAVRAYVAEQSRID